jgi:hypothetical protein
MFFAMQKPMTDVCWLVVCCNMNDRAVTERFFVTCQQAELGLDLEINCRQASC